MPKRILVVDDEPIVVELTKRMLEERGYQVFTASNGQEALDRLNDRIPDLIILDVQMPTMNGYTFIMEKAKIPEYADIPVIMMTVYDEMEPLFKRHGVKAYLLKPITMQNVVNKVNEVVGPPR